MFSKRPLQEYVLNSLIVAGGDGTGPSLASLIAYRLRGLDLMVAMRLQRWLLIGAIVPPALLAIPFFMVMIRLACNHYRDSFSPIQL
jgi:ABC-type glycerol-3-phosphate transport system permease component